MKLGEILRARGKPSEETDAAPQEPQAPSDREADDASDRSPDRADGVGQWQEEVQGLPVAEIEASPYQTRETFSEESLRELAASIEEHGVIQPIVVRPKEEGFELLVGERRLRACRLLGWERIPAVVREVDSGEAAELVLIENLQRQDLNALEEAAGYQRLMEEFKLTQGELARRLGRTQATIANKLRLLKLPGPVRSLLERGLVSERHARALLSLDSEADRIRLAEEAGNKGLTVRALEDRIQRVRERGRVTEAPGNRRVVRLYKDVRLFRNSVRQLVKQLELADVKVEMAEDDGEDVWEVRVRITKGQQQG